MLKPITQDSKRKALFLKSAEYQWCQILAANMAMILAPQHAYKLELAKRDPDYYKYRGNARYIRLYQAASSVADVVSRVLCYALEHQDIHNHNLTKHYRAFRYSWKTKHVVEYAEVKVWLPDEPYRALLKAARQKHVQFNTLVAYWVFSARIQNPSADPYIYLGYGQNPLKLEDLAPNFAELEVI